MGSNFCMNEVGLPLRGEDSIPDSNSSMEEARFFHKPHPQFSESNPFTNFDSENSILSRIGVPSTGSKLSREDPKNSPLRIPSIEHFVLYIYI